MRARLSFLGRRARVAQEFCTECGYGIPSAAHDKNSMPGELTTILHVNRVSGSGSKHRKRLGLDASEVT